jgi:hypothetical protein
MTKIVQYLKVRFESGAAVPAVDPAYRRMEWKAVILVWQRHFRDAPEAHI